MGGESSSISLVRRRTRVVGIEGARQDAAHSILGDATRQARAGQTIGASIQGVDFRSSHRLGRRGFFSRKPGRSDYRSVAIRFFRGLGATAVRVSHGAVSHRLYEIRDFSLDTHFSCGWPATTRISTGTIAATRKAELVKLRYFLGCTMGEAAQVLGITQATAEEDWTYSKAWLPRRWLRGEQEREAPG